MAAFDDTLATVLPLRRDIQAVRWFVCRGAEHPRRRSTGGSCPSIGLAGRLSGHKRRKVCHSVSVADVAVNTLLPDKLDLPSNRFPAAQPSSGSSNTSASKQLWSPV